jgi:hypothetical protein
MIVARWQLPGTGRGGQIVNSFFDRVKDLADQHDDKVDAALEKVGDIVDDKTGGKHTEHIDKAVDAAQQHTGDGDTTRS